MAVLDKNQHKNKKWEDVDSTSSNRGGLAGILESTLRRYRVIGYLLPLIPLYIIGISDLVCF